MVKPTKIIMAAAACLWLAGCNGLATGNDLVGTAAPAAQAEMPHPVEVSPPLLDYTRSAKESYLAGNYGQSEALYRQIVESQSDNAEAWLGLAASYDQLGRFDLADRAYTQLAKLVGSNAIVHNNRGYSYLMRGDKTRARQEFLAARKLDPQNAYVLNNLKSVDGGRR